MTGPRRELLRLELPLGALGAAVLGLAFLFAVVGIPPLPPAPLVRLGIPSPLTGMTRSLVTLASGDLAGALRWHPLGPAVFGACAGGVVVAAVSWARGRRIEAVASVLGRRWLWGGVATLVATVWVRQLLALG